MADRVAVLAEWFLLRQGGRAPLAEVDSQTSLAERAAELRQMLENAESDGLEQVGNLVVADVLVRTMGIAYWSLTDVDSQRRAHILHSHLLVAYVRIYGHLPLQSTLEELRSALWAVTMHSRHAPEGPDQVAQAIQVLGGYIISLARRYAKLALTQNAWEAVGEERTTSFLMAITRVQVCRTLADRLVQAEDLIDTMAQILAETTNIDTQVRAEIIDNFTRLVLPMLTGDERQAQG